MKVYALIAGTAAVGAAVGTLDTTVTLQPNAPGVTQSGHLHISGTAQAGTVVAYSSEPSGIAYGGDFRSVSNQGRGVLGNASSPTGVTYGGLFQSASSSGRGIAGISSATSGSSVGGFFVSNSTAGKGVQGTSNAVTGVNFGVYGKASSPAGFALYGDGNAAVTGSLGVGINSDNPPAYRLQVVADANSGHGAAVVHNGMEPLFGNFGNGRIGSFSQADGSGNYSLGAVGAASSPAGSAYGLFGDAHGSVGNSAYGIYAQCSGGTTSYAGYFLGDIYASSANAGVKSFLIDHPMDPANKVLIHSSVESDQRMNIYRGSVQTDSKGYATVSLPNWFSALNGEIKYQLTVIDEADSAEFVLAKVVKRLRNGKFTLRTSQPNIDVDWLVTGERHDPTSNYYPLQVEREKTVAERGRYYEPKAYGKSESLGMGHLDQTQSNRPPIRGR